MSRRGSARPYAVTCAGLLLASGLPQGGSLPPGYSFTETEENGVIIARTTSGPRFTDELFSFERLQQIRPEPETEDTFLGRPVAITGDGAGRVYVLDRQASHVVVYDTQGRYLHSIGRAGQGPGDLDRPYMLAFRGNYLEVAERSYPRRVSRFTPEGRLLDLVRASGEVRTNATGSSSTPSLIVGPGGTRMEVSTFQERQGDTNRSMVAVTFLDLEGDSLATRETPFVDRMKVKAIAGNPRQYLFEIWFTGNPDCVMAPDGSVTLTTGITSDLDVYGPDGLLSRRIVVDLPPEQSRITDADLAALDRELGIRAAYFREQAGPEDPIPLRPSCASR